MYVFSYNTYKYYEFKRTVLTVNISKGIGVKVNTCCNYCNFLSLNSKKKICCF